MGRMDYQSDLVRVDADLLQLETGQVREKAGEAQGVLLDEMLAALGPLLFYRNRLSGCTESEQEPDSEDRNGPDQIDRHR
jgi:hypothetical protein